MYNLSEALKIVLLPDGNASDLEEDEVEDEADTSQQVDSDGEVMLPDSVGPLQIERNEEIEFAEPFEVSSTTIEDDLEDDRSTPGPQSSEKSRDTKSVLNQPEMKQGAKKQYSWQKKVLKKVDMLLVDLNL